jgi:aryl-alcohol dehydrogenase-like predicted oxidoreductase
VCQVEPKDTVEAVTEALEVGYRHIDTAEMYGNETEVGEAIRAYGIDRGDVFVTSKLSNAFHRPDDVRKAFDRTLADLGFDYIDLFLIHWPMPTRYDGDFVSTWKTLEEFQRDGRARSIGVSNFQVPHLERLAAETSVVPAVNQIEVHPYFGNEWVRAYGREHGIATEAWSPLAQGQVLDDPTVVVALAPPARRRRLPEVDHAGADRGELRRLRLRARRDVDAPDQRARQGRGRPDRRPPRHDGLPPRLAATAHIGREPRALPMCWLYGRAKLPVGLQCWVPPAA